jgi:ATP/maltotriose-dependent transcriptional regulator MalT
MLLRTWIGLEGVAGRVGWVPSEREKRDPQRFWLSVLRALRQTDSGAGLVQALSAAPDLDGWAIVERLLADLAPLQGRLWLVIDDVHELGPEVLRQLELLVMRAPAELRFVLATRHDVQLGLHRLRLEKELTEIRVMRYLPTNLTGPEIARELSISRNTVKTHIRNLYAKLGTHTRAEAVTRARALGLLAPPPRTG